MVNYYEVLQVKNFAEIEVVRAAYRAVTKLYHPDTNPSADPNLIVQINLAYEVLGNPQKKEAYDRQLRAHLQTEKETFKKEKEFTKEKTEKEKSTTHKQTENARQTVESRVEPQTKIGKVAQVIGNGLWCMVDSFLDGARQMQREAENAYYRGCDLDDRTLVRMYLKSTGPKRHGLSKVLIERGLLRNENGELVPSYEFKNIARYM